MRSTGILLIALLALAVTPAATATDTTLERWRGGSALSGWGGWLAYSVPAAGGRYRLTVRHGGAEQTLPLRSAKRPFDADVGPGPDGTATVVYSRCPAGRCDLYRYALPDGPERRHPASRTGIQEHAPAIYGKRVAFGAHSRGQRRDDVLLWSPRGGHRRLKAGTLVRCEGTCETPSTAAVVGMDLGPRAAAYLWGLDGGEVIGTGYALELRVATLDGRRAPIAATGYFGGTCGFELPTIPAVDGTAAVYGMAWAESEMCDGGGLGRFERFDALTEARSTVALAAPAQPVGLALDGDALLWLRDPTNDDVPDCQSCELVRSTGLRFKRVRGGAVAPPTS